MRIAAFCDFYDDALRPLQLVVRARPGELDWTQTIYIPVSGPFEPFEPEDFGDLPGVSVLLEDLVLPKVPPEERETPDNPDHASVKIIGILLSSIAERHENAEDILQLVVQMADVEEVLKYERNR
ncbi:hypothetical protein P4H94_03295 [Paenibacillus macerans]|uniref:Uncharacterized protein n=1 Tax=Paenibacillus macerans TaxID=44252 RepID=A0A091A1D5_PAEMA|nr:hypothetical protein [Paenibacillus macerans]KFN10081.1 hypothetical protein DJ90_380 [Paenibacillus macerans]MBS5913179.1 hypothetical protein [Paenibacillus macerans]MCY7562178.1 hypothetical protein [Paenibacillus macerans]MDU5949208.1 hypothetical protein [Paenibacillus macerans]MEC0135924.1 hypothetical protein [Paenibacillus macerans]